MRPFLPILFLATAVLSGCTQFPELDGAVTEEAKAASAPEIVDNSVVLGPAAEAILDVETQAEMEARAVALEARALAASGPIISPEEKAALLERAAALRAEAARVAQEG